MRLDKFIADCTEYSRSEVKQLLKQRRVQVNQLAVKSSSTLINPQLDSITLDEAQLTLAGPLYFMLNKPAGYVCSNESYQATVLDLLSLNDKQKRSLQIAGRLDKDTTGLVLLTNDGQWNHRVTSPSRECCKHYFVTLAQPLRDTLIQEFEHVIVLDKRKGEKNKITRPAQLVIIDEYHANLVIQEGRYHQVKRMFAALGNQVCNLHRYQVGALHLDTNLQEGNYRALNEEEIHHFS